MKDQIIQLNTLMPHFYTILNDQSIVAPHVKLVHDNNCLPAITLNWEFEIRIVSVQSI